MLDTDKIAGRHTVAKDAKRRPNRGLASRRITSAPRRLESVFGKYPWGADFSIKARQVAGIRSVRTAIISFITSPENYRAEIFEQAR